uniref:Ankyrin repeat protein n=1 Tax=Pithovirus LCPAC404 TaxID=2506597 RepID=A0A481ZED4_9VIRU|nr:MAG: ankyrin repeat protein [Pithovirus LCPAC404]
MDSKEDMEEYKQCNTHSQKREANGMEITPQAILDVLISGWPYNPTLESIERLNPIWYDYLKDHRHFWADNNHLTKRGEEIKDDVISLVYVASNGRDWRFCLKNAAIVGNFIMFNYAESRYLEERGGYTDLEDVNWFMTGAAEGGNLKYVKYFASKGGDDWDGCMLYASDRGHYEVVEYCAKQGGTRWSDSARNAAEYGCINIMRMASYQKEIIDWDSCMRSGARSEYMLVVEFAESKGADNFNECMKDTAKYGNDLSLIEHLERKGADNFNECMSQAAYAGNFEFVQHFQLKGANNFHECMQHASWSGHLNIIKHFEKQIISRYHSIFSELPTCIVDVILSFEDIIDWNEIMIKSIISTEKQWLEIIMYAEKKGADNWDQCLYYAKNRDVYSLHDLGYKKIIAHCKLRGGDSSRAEPDIGWDDYDSMEYEQEQENLRYEETLKYAKNKMIECGCY